MEVDLREDVLGDHRVLLHDLPLLVVEGAGLLQDALGDPDLADVVEEGADLDGIELGAGVAEPPSERDGDGGDPLGVAARVVVLGLHALRERRDRGEVRPANPLDQVGALDRRRQLRQDRLAQSRPARAVATRDVLDLEAADDLAAGDELLAARAVMAVHMRARAGEPRKALLGVGDQLDTVVCARGQPAGELEERLQVVVLRRQLGVRLAQLLVRVPDLVDGLRACAGCTG